ncbi:GumC family protein [Chroococcidiopsis sp.]|uniref:GumC family protein n=1 Tax=Chroococcidiopsis sp. TaxID=3088168 RepID=UPI003F401AC8
MESQEHLNLDLQKYWESLKRNWLPAVATFGLVSVLATLVACLQQPEYEAQGKLLLKISRTPSLTGVGQQLEELDPPLAAKSSPLNTEIEIIRSIPLVQQTINALNLKDQNGTPLDPQTIIKQQLDVKNIGATDVLLISYKSNDSTQAAVVVNKLMNLYITRNLLANRTEAVTANKFIAKQLPIAEASVSQVEAALRQFKEKNQIVALDEEAKSAVKIIEELENKIKQTEADLADATTRSANLQQKVGMTSKDALAINSLNQSLGVQKVLEEFQQVESQIVVQQNRFLDDNPTIIDLKRKRDSLTALLHDRIQQALGTHTQVSNRNLQIGKSQQKLIEDFAAMEGTRLALNSRLASLSKAQSSFKKRLNTLPKLEQEQRELQRRLAAAQSTYQTLLQKFQEVRLAENQNTGNATIIENALVPRKASIRKPALIIILGILLGIFLSTSAVLILEITDKSIKSLREVKVFFGYAVIGNIPYFGKIVNIHRQNGQQNIPPVFVRDMPDSPISEAFNILQANLKFFHLLHSSDSTSFQTTQARGKIKPSLSLGNFVNSLRTSNKAFKTIVVTSSIPKEGKSTVSANLAATMAEIGRKVLLVDANMHHPIQHQIWRLTNTSGLSNILTSQAGFEVIEKSDVANLDILTAGVIPPKPIALLDSQRMSLLIDYFSARYDFVIIDAPAFSHAADALTLSHMSDAVLFIARPGLLNYVSAEAAKELLERSSQKSLGLVINSWSQGEKFNASLFSAGKINLKNINIASKKANLKCNSYTHNSA